MTEAPQPAEARRRGPPGRRAAAREARRRRGDLPGGVLADAAASSAGAGVRLNKVLASRGVGARRKCDALIQAGSVRVNGTVVKEPGTRVVPDRDRIEVHGRPIPGRSALRYLMVHKPEGFITTLDDPEGRPTVRTLLPPGPRLFPVGRLDAETSGLIIATNDGTLAHHLMHPRYGVRKLYRVRLDRPPDAEQVRRLRSGVEFEPRVVSAPCDVRVRNARAARAEIEIVLHEGRYRQVRRMCEAVGLAVRGLHRPAYGPLRLGALPRGAWRELTADEVRRLRAASARPVPRVPRVPRVAAKRVADRPVGIARPGPQVRRGATGAPPRSRPPRPGPQVRRGATGAPARSRPPRPGPQVRRGATGAPARSRPPRPGPQVRRGATGAPARSRPPRRAGSRGGMTPRAPSGRPNPRPAARSGQGQGTAPPGRGRPGWPGRRDGFRGPAPPGGRRPVPSSKIRQRPTY